MVTLSVVVVVSLPLSSVKRTAVVETGRGGWAGSPAAAGWAAGTGTTMTIQPLAPELLGSKDNGQQTRSQQDKSATRGTINHARPQDKGHEP